MFTAARGLAALGVQVEIAYLGDLRNPSAVVAARRKVRQLAPRFDVVHSQYGSACAAVTGSCSKATVLSLRGSDWERYSSSLNSVWVHTRLARWLSRMALPRFRAVTCPSYRMAADVARRVRPGTVLVVLPSAIDLPKWPSFNQTRQARRPPYRLLFTANNVSCPIKRVRLVESAAAIASTKIGEVQVVRATGIPHTDMPGLVSSCDAVACASDSEGWPNSVKEALACGLPFVSTDVSDLRQIADAEPSCRIAAADPELFARELCHVLTAGRDARLRRFVEPMSLELSARKLLSIYEQVGKG
jgi:hypothetical protein